MAKAALQHGSRSSYTRGCRCGDCRAANTQAVRKYKAAVRARGSKLRVSAEPVREHLRMLLASGLTLAAIARASGIARNQLSRLLNGRKDLPPAAVVSAEIAAAILGVDEGASAQSIYVKADEIRLMIADLLLRGWTLRDIGGNRVSAQELSRIVRAKRLTVLNATAVVVADFYHDHRYDRGGASRSVISRARNRGYLPLWRVTEVDDAAVGAAQLDPDEALALEGSLELRILPWLEELVDSELGRATWTVTQQKFVLARCWTVSGAYLPTTAMSDLAGTPARSLRVRLREVVCAVVSNPVVDLGDRTEALRIYLTHPAIAALAR